MTFNWTLPNSISASVLSKHFLFQLWNIMLCMTILALNRTYFFLWYDVNTHAHKPTHAQIHTHTYTHAHIYTHIYARTHTHTHARAHKHTHKHAAHTHNCHFVVSYLFHGMYIEHIYWISTVCVLTNVYYSWWTKCCMLNLET